jgi:hypothetical protein
MDIIFWVIWLICGIFAYFYYGYKTKWEKFKTWWDYLSLFVMITLLGMASFYKIMIDPEY